MFDRPVRTVMRRRNVVTASPDTTVHKVATLMAGKNVGAVLVVDGEELVGIITERDVVFRVVARGLDASTTAVVDVMTPEPHTTTPDVPFGSALAVMHEKGFRHMPVIEDGKPVGIVSARSAMDPEMEDFAAEALRREHYRART
jgi:CBS domain-containing protein